MSNQFSYLKKIPQEEVNEIKRKFLFSKRKINGECWEWHGPMVAPKNRYGYTTHNFGEKKKKYMCHRLSYLLWKGDIPSGMCVCHTCDNTKCFNPAHLFLGTNLENQQDMIEKGRGRKSRGETTHTSKLKENHIFEIRKLRGDGWKHKDLSKKFGISLSTVHYILTNKTWKHLEV